MEINTTLLREKFILTGVDSGGGVVPITASSNRIPLVFKDASGDISEKYVVRAQNMHIAVRMVEVMVASFMRLGPLMSRQKRFDFAAAFNSVLSTHENNFNPNKWVAVYSNGRVVFSVGEYHQFLDVIEKCDAINPGNYDLAIGIAEEMFLKLGQKLSINYQSNIGMVINVSAQNAKCGLVLRNPHKNTTFNFVIDKKGGADDEVRFSPSFALNMCAAFLEGIQLAVRIGILNENVEFNKKETTSALRRMTQMNMAIASIENRFNVNYRPEKPTFSEIVKETEAYRKNLSASKV